MTSLQKSDAHAISLTAQAASKLKELKQNEGNPIWGLRFGDQKGFCGSGYEYVIDFASEPGPQDEVFYSHGIPIYVSKESLQRLQGSTIEFHAHAHEDHRMSPLEKKGFMVSNPNVKGPCPCACDRGYDA